jgi:AraC-like DNA-binding protein
VEQARYVDKMWGSVRTMVDERSARGWLSSYRANELRDLGLSGVPEHAVVGFMTSDRDAPDDVEQMLARDAFQRACVDLARAAKDVACGRVGEHGVVFLLSNVGSPARLRHFVTDLGNRVSALARKRFGFTLHLGASVEGPTLPLSARYEQALGAAENALSRGISFTMAEPDLLRAMTPVRRLREQLGLVSQERSSVLITRFERYVDAVAAACGQRMEAFRAHLDAGFDRALQALRHTGALEQRSQLEMYEALDRAARDAATVDALVAAYRRAIADLVDAAERPVAAAQDRSLRRALAYIDRHFTEPLSFSNVARVAGFAPRHFSRLFKQQQAVTFEEYIRRLRVERAKQLLEDTDLSVERVAQLSGFTLRPYFHRVFKEALGATPLEFRNAKR